MAMSSSSLGSSRYVDVGADGDAHVPVSSTDELDPSLAGGFRVIYDRETPFELRIQDADNTPQQIGTLEAIKVKILILGSDTDIHVVRLELSTESDLFFLYTHTCDLESFHAMQEQQKLMVDFADYANVLIRMLNNCIKEPHNHLAVYLMQADGRARLDFIQNMEYKFIELLSVDFMRASEDTIRQHITFRYSSMKSRLQVLQTRLHEVNSIVKTKNPSLLLQLQKTVPSPSSSRNRYLTH
ncbi:Spindle assembly protein [Phytophthora cinnamomi]|uniref:Spindle assembly protein n=1 Tax=Phytophthora cinnamomi TaxID=4785 RepID=UPI0035598E1A|nr:Spindle assembly protein [Phytophthora cinnamomi]